MSNTAKIVIGVLVILVLVALAYGMRGSGTPAEGTDASDQALQNDTAAIDAEMQGLEGDRAVIDQGLETEVSAQ
ncbi:MAG: hypothetical protein QOE22_304 [Candidatus Parcubacteria bacterium]|jgi:hypothetical protein|nr:hypothetical protein [Candidatus Parcubacteria bacterium]